MRCLQLIVLLCACSPLHAAASDDWPLGEWATQGYSARVRLHRCDRGDQTLCGSIIWLWEPTDAAGAPPRDARNPKIELRNRPLIGLPLLTSFRREPNAKTPRWIDGSIYDPESGRTYRATIAWRSIDILEVEGCVLFVCRTQVWRRAESLCAR